MLSTVSPVMVGAEAASPQPTRPLSASMRTSTLSARALSTPAMTTGLIIETEVAGQDFLAVLPKRRRRAPHRTGGGGELERNPEHLQGAGGRMLDGLDHPARGRLRILERFGDRIDLAARNSRRFELG